MLLPIYPHIIRNYFSFLRQLHLHPMKLCLFLASLIHVALQLGVCLLLRSGTGVVCVFAISFCFAKLYGCCWGWCLCTWARGGGMCMFLVVGKGCKWGGEGGNWVAIWYISFGCQCIDHIKIWVFAWLMHLCIGVLTKSGWRGEWSSGLLNNFAMYGYWGNVVVVSWRVYPFWM